MKAVMLSIQPKWCELIATGKKTVEVRKTVPKLKPPFKCYVYMTKEKDRLVEVVHKGERLWGDIMYQEDTPLFVKTFDKDSLVGSVLYSRCGKVIGEFVCDGIDEFQVFENNSVQYWNYHNLEKSCLTYEQIAEYVGKNKVGYAWHISDLQIYDTPKELSEFRRLCEKTFCDDCHYERYYASEHHSECLCNFLKPLTRPPQSWCYVEV